MLKISIITTSFNSEKEIEKTILSVISQNYPIIQYIVVDGGSTDNTKKIVEKHRDKIDVFISEADKGVYDAMNKGIKMAEGDYVIFMNSGDVFASPNVVSSIFSNLSNVDYLVYGDSYRKYIDHTELRKEKTNMFKLTRKNICHQSIFYPVKIIKKLEYDFKYPVFADWALNIYMYKLVNFQYKELPVCIFDATGISSGGNRYKDRAFLSDLGGLIIKNLGILPYLYFITRKTLRQLLCRNLQ